MPYPRVATLKTAAAFRDHLERSGIPLAFDDRLALPAESPLARSIVVDDVRVGNRFCILPMEGWDGTRDGEPSDLTRRRWRNFGTSGAKLIWGGEAVAVRRDGRANPNQLLMTPATQPALDRRFPGGVRVVKDGELERLEEDFAVAARLARDAGFRFVDVKACHGYLGHELLGARGRSGPYGGSLENRTRFMRQVIERIRAEVPGLQVVVRLSVFDMVPYRKRADGIGEPEPVEDEQPSRLNAQISGGFGIVSSDDQLDA